jgi:hypothetical protein
MNTHQTQFQDESPAYEKLEKNISLEFLDDDDMTNSTSISKQSSAESSVTQSPNP